MRDNMGVTKDNQFSPAAPELLPPVDVILPWLFEVRFVTFVSYIAEKNVKCWGTYKPRWQHLNGAAPWCI